MKLEQYTDFNRSKKVTVTTLLAGDTEIGALCRYEGASYDDFLLPQATFTYVAKGWKRMLVDQKEYLLTAGDLLFLPKHTVIFSEIPQTGNPFESINICVPQEFETSGLKNKIRFFQQDPVIKAIAEILYPAFTTKQAASGFPVEKLRELLEYCCPKQRAEHPEKTIHPQDEKRVVTAITEHLFKPLTSPEMASACYMSLASYKRKFEAVFHESPKSWIRKRKLEKAWFQLSTAKETVLDVCEKVGFENNAHFGYQFKKHFGVSPGAARKSAG